MIGEDAHVSKSDADNNSIVTYEVKIIGKKGPGVEVRKWDETQVFSDLSSMRSRLMASFREHIGDDEQFALGYIEPGHGAKGRQIVLDEDKDLTEMYRVHLKKKKIVLWMKKVSTATVPSKRPPQTNETCINLDSEVQSKFTRKVGTKSKYSEQMDKMYEVQQIVEKLTEQHDQAFTQEQIRAWAHLIQMKKHDSYEKPPAKPFFKGKGPAKVDKVIPDSLSLGRRIQYRSQCIEQLEKWHTLMERGAISHDQYSDLQQSILSDIQRF